MSKVTLSYPVVNQKDSTEEPKVTTALKALEEFLNGAKIESTDNIKPEGITEASLTAAIQTKLANKAALGLEFESKGVNFEAETGKLYSVSAEITATLPAATAGRIVGVFNNIGSNKVCKISAKAGKKIIGDFVEGQEVVTLTEHQHLVVQADGTNWWIIAGEPKREQTYSALTERTLSTLYEPSATRDTLVMVEFQKVAAGEAACGGSVAVGGVQLPKTLVEKGQAGLTYAYPSFICGAGVKWEPKTSGGFDRVLSSYQLR